MKSVGHLINNLKKPKMEFVKESQCEGCNRKVDIYKSEIIGGRDKGKTIKIKYGCKYEDLKLAREAVKKGEQAKFNKLRNTFLSQSLINDDLLEATIDDFIPESDSQKKALKYVKHYIERFPTKKDKNIMLHGSYGIGKSHLAKSIADEIIKKDYTAIFIATPMLLRKVRATYDTDSKISEDELIDSLIDVDLLVLDDIGAERATDWAIERLFDLINARLGKHTIYTTNYSPEDLMKIFGERDYSRLKHHTEQIEMEGTNFRLK